MKSNQSRQWGEGSFRLTQPQTSQKQHPQQGALQFFYRKGSMNVLLYCEFIWRYSTRISPESMRHKADDSQKFWKWEKRRKKESITFLVAEKLGDTREKDMLYVQRNKSSVKRRKQIKILFSLFRDDSANSVPVSCSCAVSIHWTGRICSLYWENLDRAWGTTGLTELFFSYIHQSYAEKVWWDI